MTQVLRGLPNVVTFRSPLFLTQKATPDKVSPFGGGKRWWWEEVDSNHRSRRRQIYSLIHLAALESSRWAESTICGVFYEVYSQNMGSGDCR